MKKALIVWGGWHGHEPELCAHIVEKMLRKHDFDVRIETQTTVFEDPGLDQLDLIVPIYTMSKIENQSALTSRLQCAQASDWPVFTAACAMPFATRWTTSS